MPVSGLPNQTGPAHRAYAVLRGALGTARPALRAGRALAALLFALTCFFGAVSARADATVNANTPQDLADAMAQGGLVKFAQDGTITFTNTIVVTNVVTLDPDGHSVTLSGNNKVQLFRLHSLSPESPANLTLNGLTLTGGRNTNGGALYVEANTIAILTNCVLTGNTAGSGLTNSPNRGSTNVVVLTNGFSSVITTNSSTITLIPDPFSSFPLTNTLTITTTALQTNNLFGVTNTVPTAGVSVTNRLFSTNTVSFTNTITTTNITLVTNVFDTLFGTNMVVDTSTIVERDTNLVTTFLIPATHVEPAPGSDGGTGSDSSFGRGGGGGSGRAGLPGLGGAIFNRGQLSLLNCTLSTNNASGGNGGNGGDGGSGAFKGGNGGSGGKGNTACGGAVYNDRNGGLFIQNCSFNRNTATSGSGGTGGAGGSGVPSGLAGNGGAAGLAYGGAVYNAGSVTNDASTFFANSAAGGNGAAGGTAGGGSGNTGQHGGNAFGGAIYNASVLLATNCTFYNNSVTGGTGGDGGPADSRAGRGGDGGTGAGGAVFNARTAHLKNAAVVINCSFWQNSATGGAKGAAGSGVVGNSDGSAGAAHGGNLASSGGPLQIGNSAIGAAGSGRDAYGSIKDLGFNIWSDKSVTLSKNKKNPSSNSKNGVDPVFGSFGDFGGPTFTISLGTNSPATNFIPPLYTVVDVDQRGVPRPQQGTNSDAGSVEETSAPLLLVAPQDLVQTNGGSATFKVFAAGSELTYQWRLGGTNIAGATGASYTLTNVSQASEGIFDVMVSNRFGFVISEPGASLTVVGVPPEITTQPTNRMALPGTMVGLAVAATGSLPLSYQWVRNGTNLTGATSSTLIFSSVSGASVGSYTVVVTNAFGAVTSAPPAVLTLGAIPSITVPPANQNVPLGSNAVFSVTAQGTLPLLYQWQFNGTNVPGACGTNLSTFTLPNVQLTDAGPYSVVVSNQFGSLTSAPANLTVLTTPLITAQPQGRTVLVGSNVTFSVTAIGSQPLSYQWRYNTIELIGETAATHICYNVQTSDSGTYDVIVTDVNNNSVTSSPAVMTVLTPVSLSGRLTDAVTSAGLAGVTVNLTNQLGVLSTNTDATGYYVFTNLWPQSNYTVFPAEVCEVFQPAFTNVVLPAAGEATVDFTGLTNNTFSIQGQITDTLSGISSVSVQLTNASGTQTLQSDGAGYYAFSRLCPGTYRLTPSAPGYVFSPASLSVSVGPDLNNVNFTAVPVFTLTGRVTDAASGNGLGGVSVHVNNTNTILTDANGYFTSTNLPAGNYTLTPVLACYRFTPPAATLPVGATSANTTNFVANNESYQLGGSFNAGTNTLAHFTLVLTGGNVTNYLTVTNGSYAFTNLCPGTYTVAPRALGCYQFLPTSHSVAVGPDNLTQDFLVLNSATIFSASGHITVLGTNALPGVAVATVGTNVASGATSDDTGAFHLVALCPGVYELVPSLTGYRFSPASVQVVLGANTNGLDFAALPVLSLAATNGSPAQLSFPVLPGLTYTLTASSNLLDWLSLFTTNVDSTDAAAWVSFSDSSSTQAPVRFYRLGDVSTVVTNAP